jgi:hypothetical protein
VDPIIHVTSVFRAKIEGVGDIRDVPDIKAQEAVRKSLYDMAANECAILAETLKADCRLSNIVIIVPITRGDDRVFVKESGRPKLDVIPHTLDDYAS